MTKKWIAINLLLLAITGLLARQLYVSVLRFNAENDLAKIQPVRDMKQKMVQENLLPKLPPAKSYNASEFTVIPEKNVFTESRSKEEKTEITAPPEPQPLTPKPILVGVIISEGQKTAAIIDPTGSSQNQSRKAQIKRIGDVYHGYTITGIALDRIVLESGTRREIIPLHEGSKRARGGKTPILSTRVVSFGAGGASGGITVNIVSGGTGTARTSVAPVSVPAPVAAGQPVAGQSAPASARQAAATAQQQAQPVQQQAPSTGGTDASKGRIIRTPFGDIVRPNRDK